MGLWVEVESMDHADICTCDPRALGQDHIEGAYERAEANVELIALAPDMYRALKRLVTYFPKGAPETREARAIINSLK